MIQRYFPPGSAGEAVDLGPVEDSVVAVERRLDGFDGISDVGDVGSSQTVTAGNGNGGIKLITLTAATCAFTFNRGVLGQVSNLELVLTQDATGGRLATWPVSVVWAGGTEPTLSIAPGAIDRLGFVSFDDGTTWFGRVVGQAYA